MKKYMRLTYVVMRATLAGREDGLIDTLLEAFSVLEILAEKDETCTRATESLMSGRSDDIAVFKGIRKRLRRYQTGRVRDIGHEERAMLIRGCAQTGVVPVARIGGCTADDKTGLEQARLLSQLLVVDELSGWVETIRERLEINRGSGNLLLGGLCE